MIKKYLAVLISALFFIGCGSSNDTSANYANATLYNYDNTTLGMTRNEASVNGAYVIYEFGTGNPIGSIGFDAIAYSTDGTKLGLCGATIVSDKGVIGDCVLPNTEPVLPCPDTRDGQFLASPDPSYCALHGYFYCSIAGTCLDKPANVNYCGEIGSEQRRIINEGT